MDGEGTFQFVEYPVPYGDKPKLKPAPPYIFNTPPSVLMDGPDYIPPNMC